MPKVRVTLAVSEAALDVLPQVVDGDAALIVVCTDIGNLTLTGGTDDDMVSAVATALRWLIENHGEDAANEAVRQSRMIPETSVVMSRINNL